MNGTVISQLMSCPVRGDDGIAGITVSTDTPGAEITAGLLVGTMPCDGCGKPFNMSVRVTGGGS